MSIHRKQHGDTILNIDGAVGISLLKDQGCEFVELTLQPGTHVPPHVLPIPVTVYVSEGSGTVTIDEQSIDASQGDAVSVGAGKQRSWSAHEQGCRLFVVKHLGASV